MCAVFTGKNLIQLNQTDSTNIHLTQLAQDNNLPEGTVVNAAFQTHGKGQRNNSWEAEKGMNITFSVLYKPHFLPLSKHFLLSKAISLGVFDYLNCICAEVKVKWPNDIYVGNKKIAGILIENSIKGNNIYQSVIGIGININQSNFSTLNATSLLLENNQLYNIEEQIEIVFSCIEKRYLQLKNNQYEQINQEYLMRLYLYQTWHNFTLANTNILTSKIINAEENGNLVVEDKYGKIYKFAFKEIVF